MSVVGLSDPAGPAEEARGALALLLGAGLSGGLSLLYSVYVARVLGPAGSADYFGALFIVSFFGLALGPIGSTVTRFASLAHARGDGGGIAAVSRAVTRRVWATAALLVCVAAPAAPALAALLHFESVATLALAGAISLLTALAAVPRGVLRGVQHFRVYAWSAVLECVARLLSGALLLLFVPSVHAALLAYVLGLVTAQTAARLHLRSLPAPPPGAGVGSASLARFAVPMFALTLLAAGFHSLDMLFVKHRFSAPEAGIYGAAGAAGRVFALLFSPFRVLLLPASSALRAQGRPAEGLLLRASAGFLLLAAVPLVAVAIAPDAIITVIYGERFAPAGALLLLMACSSILGFLPLLIAQALAAAEQWRWLALYALGLAGEWVALLAWGASPDRVVRIALAAKAATCLLLVGYYAAWRPRARLEEPRATTVAEPLGALGRGAWD